MKLTKAERETVRGLFDGRCAYCGHPLPERWHADHIEPIHRTDWVRKLGYSTDGSPRKPENDILENCFPSCPQCNISKGAMTLENWRAWLAGHVSSLNKHHSIYRLARSYGLVVETGNPVRFYFETAGRAALESQQ